MFSKQFLIRFPNNIISRNREIAEKEEDEDMCDTAHSWGNFHGTLRAERDGKRKDMKSHSGKNGCQIRMDVTATLLNKYSSDTSPQIST